MEASSVEHLEEKVDQQNSNNNVTTNRNIYPFVRHIFIICLALFMFSILLFLIYHNGKSIYENGL